jgi:hypothetical protein
VQVKFAEKGTILIRDSKDQHDPSSIIHMPSSGWMSLLKHATNPVRP